MRLILSRTWQLWIVLSQEGCTKLQGSLQDKQLNRSILPLMMVSCSSCLKELREDSVTSTGFKDLTGVFKELMGEDWDTQKVIKNASTEQFIALTSGVLKVSKVSASLRFLISPQHWSAFTTVTSKWHLREKHRFPRLIMRDKAPN